jgi:Bacterial extracellular solute-binding protein
VKAGAPKPEMSTVDALKGTLLAAKSIGCSDSASGVYLATELFPKLGVWDQIKSKSRKIEADPVGGFVATGEVEIGFQQISELRPVKGIDIVGELPPGAQTITVFAAGIPTTSKQSGSRQGADPMAGVTGRLSRDKEERPRTREASLGSGLVEGCRRGLSPRLQHHSTS